MISITDKRKCSGCSACNNICPVKAIKMRNDKEGFLYPTIDQNICIKCNLCEQVCPFQNEIRRPEDLMVCFAGYNKNAPERKLSSSGGIFLVLAQAVLSKGGIIFGAAYDEQFMVYHTTAENKQELKRLVGSKYLQSRIGDVYMQVKEVLKTGRKILFVGTTCQIGGLRGYLGKDYDNLICVDFICLGIPSPQIWSDYLDTFFDRSKINFINFKDKNWGWHRFSLRINSQDKEFVRDGRETYYFTGYFRQLYSRPSCSDCIFKKGNRVSDITISDCWGYTSIAPELDDNKGLSSIICHTQKGLELFESVKDMLIWKNANAEDVLKYNNNYCTSAPMGKQRNAFWKDYDRLPKEKLFIKYCSPERISWGKKIATYVKEKIEKLIGIK